MTKMSGYEICNAALMSLQREMDDFETTRAGMEPKDAVNAKANLARGVATLQAEMRKTAEDAKKAIDNLDPARQVELVLGIIKDFSPEHRAAVRLYCEELGDKVIT